MRQMKLVEDTVVTLVGQRRPDAVADRLIAEVELPAAPVGRGQLQVLRPDLGDHPPVSEDRVGGAKRRRRVRLVPRPTLPLRLAADDQAEHRVVGVGVAGVVGPQRHADVERHGDPGDDERSHHVQLHRIASPHPRRSKIRELSSFALLRSDVAAHQSPACQLQPAASLP